MIAFILALVTIVFRVSAYAQEYPGGYIVRPTSEGNLSPEESALIDRNGADRTIPFWELPLWVKIAYLTGSIRTIFGSIIIVPMAVRKIKKSLINRNKESIIKYIENSPGCIMPHITRGGNISGVR